MRTIDRCDCTAYRERTGECRKETVLLSAGQSNLLLMHQCQLVNSGPRRYMLVTPSYQDAMETAWHGERCNSESISKP